MWTASMEQPSGMTGDASGKPKASGGSENIGERLPQLRIASNSQPEPQPEPEPDPLWSYVSGGTMGDSFSIAGMAGAVWMANASSPAAYDITESGVSCARRVWSARERIARENRTNLGWDPRTRRHLCPGNLYSRLSRSLQPGGTGTPLSRRRMSRPLGDCVHDGQDGRHGLRRRG